jgi:hypothetical protein
MKRHQHTLEKLAKRLEELDRQAADQPGSKRLKEAIDRAQKEYKATQRQGPTRFRCRRYFPKYEGGKWRGECVQEQLGHAHEDETDETSETDAKQCQNVCDKAASELNQIWEKMGAARIPGEPLFNPHDPTSLTKIEQEYKFWENVERLLGESIEKKKVKVGQKSKRRSPLFRNDVTGSNGYTDPITFLKWEIARHMDDANLSARWYGKKFGKLSNSHIEQLIKEMHRCSMYKFF